MAFHSVISIHRMFMIRLTTLIEQSCKYSNNTVKCYLITTKLALNLAAIKGTIVQILIIQYNSTVC